tara:strand:+ start:1194 stop:1409 length:216 start_codon:yes stop_codon:yes gene_type:complete
MKTFTTLQSTKITSKELNTFCTIDKVRKDGTKRVFFAVRNEEGKNIVSTMFARKYDAETVVKKWFKHLATK